MRKGLLFGLIITATLWVIVLAHQPQKIAPGFGGIEGYVIDTAGHPVSGAKVYALNFEQPLKGRSPFVYTDKEGGFLLDGLRPGTYSIRVAKEEEGYPDTFFAFFLSSALPQVDVQAQRVTKDIVVRLGPKAARIAGRVVEAKTGQPIDNARMILCRKDNPNNCYGAGLNGPGAQFELLVPSVAFTLKVSAPGYQDWHYGNDGSKGKSKAIQLAPGTIKKLTISLSLT